MYGVKISGMERFIEIILAEWRVIKGAPITFGAAILVSYGADGRIGGRDADRDICAGLSR